MDETGIVFANQGYYSLISNEVPSNKVASKNKENAKLRVTFTSFCSLGGDVHSPIFIAKNFSRSLKKEKSAKKTDTIDKKCFDNFVLYRNKNGWMTKSVFSDILSTLNKKLDKEGKKILLWVDNASPHKIANEFSNIRIEFFRPNMTPLIQPQDQAFYATLKSRFQKYKREFLITREESPTQAEMFEKISELTLGLDPEFIKSCWKLCGLTDLTNSPDESLQIASAISIMKLEEDDEYDTCEPEPDRDRDNSIEVVQIPTAPPLSTLESTTNKK